MKIAVRLAALFALLVMPALANAQEANAQEPQAPHPLAGYWSGPMTESEDSEVLVEFRIIGDVVTGPIVAKGIGDLYIRDGQVTANSIQFVSPTLNPQGEGPSLVWTGQLLGNSELAFSVVPEGGGAASEFVLKKRVETPGGR